VPAELSGRNDLTADGRKFSGSAFFLDRGRSLHHGTLLVNVDMEKMERYLRPSEAKLRAKGVDSVRSRVVNLSSFNQSVTVPALRERLKEAFEEVYGLSAERVELSSLDINAINMLCERNRSWEWLFGRKLPMDFSCEGRFSWGEIQLELFADGGRISRLSVWTDAMDWTLAGALEDALIGCRFDISEICEKISAVGKPQAEDICELLRKQDL
ncbi:MAG: lipoate--protein ligase, partial [Oscillospiraceae bacterium]|nr:lipoate--protein ligase [Oscillospiraceae bacterium]